MLLIDLLCEIRAKRVHAHLVRRIGRVPTWSGPHSDCRDRCTEVWRLLGFPWFEPEIQPRPGTREITRLHLQRPHVRERRTRVSAERSLPHILRAKDRRVQHRLRTARLAGLWDSPRLIGIKRSNLVPLSYAFQHVLDQRRLGRRRLLFAE